MSTSFELAASSIGALAYAVCQSPSTASVAGATSRGLFLHVPPRRIVFVSLEPYRSPLTINLAQPFDQLDAIEIGAGKSASCQPGRGLDSLSIVADPSSVPSAEYSLAI